MEYYSQYGQDKFLDETVFKKKQNGFFVEVGVCDAIRLSNTYFFEKARKWKGLCIEPNPVQYAKLIKSGRTAQFENYAITDQEGEMDFLAIEGYGKALSGLVDFYNSRHKERIKSELKGKNSKQTIVKVKTIPLHSLLQLNNITTVDYCSIDVEGAELSVLQSIDFDAVDIHCFSIENNYQDKKITKLMKTSGYKMVRRISCDEIYVKVQK